MSSSRARLAVVYDRGAVSPWEIGVGLGDLGDVVFLTGDSPHAQEVGPVLAELGEVVPLTGDTARDGAALRALSCDAILTYSEAMLRTTAALAAEASLPYHSVELTQVLTNKVRQRQVLREAGVDDVRSHPLWSPDDWAGARAAVGLPAVLKPVTGAASARTFAIMDDARVPEILERAFTDVPPRDEPLFVLEELLQGRPSGPYGDYVSVEGMCGPSGTRQLAVTGKLPLLPPFRETGHFWPARLSADERAEVMDLADRAVRALGIERGITHTEIKLTADGPRLIEVNGRLGGWVNGIAGESCGVDMVNLAGRIALGEDPEPPNLTPKGVYFQYHWVAPTRPCVVEAVNGRREALEIPGVQGCRSLVRAGDEPPGGVVTNDLVVVWGTCDDHDAMAVAVERAMAVLSLDLRFTDGTRRMTAADLRAEPVVGAM